MDTRKTLVIAVAISTIAIGLAVVMGLRFFAYSFAHGGGIPELTRDGQTVLHNHGRVTHVEQEVYDEARRRMWWAAGSIVFGLFSGFLALFWHFRCLQGRQARHSASREREQ